MAKGEVRTRPWGLVGFCVAALVAAGGSLFYLKKQQGDNSNYLLSRSAPKGWTEVPHGPQTLFLYKDPKSGLLLRGAQNQIVAEFNPTPDENNGSLAQFYIDRTQENLKGWTAKMSDSVQAHGGGFQIIDRQREGKRVVTAFGVRGNSTFVVSLSGNGKNLTSLDEMMPWFKTFLAEAEFRPVDYDLYASR